MSFALIRGKGPVRGDGHLLDAKTLRKGIPAGPLLGILVEAALAGQLRQIDMFTGEDIGPAKPIGPLEQMKLAQYLLDKRLPTSKAEEVEEGPRVDLAKVPLTAEEIKRLPLSEIARVIEATFEVKHDGSLPDSHPSPIDP